MPDPAGIESHQASVPADSQPSTPPDEPLAPGSKRAIGIVFLVVFIDLLGFGIVLPLLPVFGEGYVAQMAPGGKESWAGGAILGLLMATFSAMQFIFAPVWGRVSDRAGRRPILLLGLGVSVVFYALFGYASGLPASQAALALTLLFAARIGQGVGGATIATAQAVIADCTTPMKRKIGMALIGAAFGIGFTFGPLIGFGALRFFPGHHEAIGYTAASLSCLALVLGAILLPETRQLRTAPSDRRWFNWQGIRNALRTPAIAPVVLTFFLATLGFGSFETTLALFNKDALRLSEDDSFLIFAYVGFSLLFAQGFLYRRLAPRWSEVTFMAVGIALMAIGVGSLGGVSWMAVEEGAGFPLLLTCTLLSLTAAVIGFAFLTPSAQALISRRSDPGRQGEILGVNQSAAALARILGPIFGVTLYKLHPSHLLPYLFGGLLVALMLPLIPRIRRG